MDVHEVRRTNLIALIRKRFNDNAAAFARAVARSDSQISQLIKGTRKMGEKQVRRFERELHLSNGVMDRVDMAEINTARQTPPAYLSQHIDPETQSRLLRLFGNLTRRQQATFITEIEAAVRANEIIVREVGRRLCPPDDATVAKHLPPPPGIIKK